MTLEEYARKMRKLIIQSGASLPDKDVSTAPAMCPTPAELPAIILAGTRINWNGIVKRASVTLHNVEAEMPDKAPTLWEEIAYHDGIRIIPTTITPGLAFGLDELGWWDGKTYKSKHPANTWTPEQAPGLWEVVTDG